MIHGRLMFFICNLSALKMERYHHVVYRKSLSEITNCVSLAFMLTRCQTSDCLCIRAFVKYENFNLFTAVHAVCRVTDEFYIIRYLFLLYKVELGQPFYTEHSGVLQGRFKNTSNALSLQVA